MKRLNITVFAVLAGALALTAAASTAAPSPRQLVVLNTESFMKGDFDIWAAQQQSGQIVMFHATRAYPVGAVLTVASNGRVLRVGSKQTTAIVRGVIGAHETPAAYAVRDFPRGRVGSFVFRVSSGGVAGFPVFYTRAQARLVVAAADFYTVGLLPVTVTLSIDRNGKLLLTSLHAH
jgi:hypothetical protein